MNQEERRNSPIADEGNIREDDMITPHPSGNEPPEMQDFLDKAAVASFSDDAESVENDAILSVTQNVKPKLCTISNLLVILPVLITPFMFGYANGIFGVYITMYGYATNCKLYNAKRSCEYVDGVKCNWTLMKNQSSREDGYLCTWRDKTTCYTTYFEEGPCRHNKACAWNTDDKNCGNRVGYTSTKSGLFGAAMIIGSFIGGVCSGVLTTKINFRLSFLCIGCIALVGCVLIHISTAFYQFWVMFVARIVLGFPIGWQSYASMAYTNTFAPPVFRETFGTIFLISMSMGAFIGPVIGLAVGNTIWYSKERKPMLKGRLQGLVAVLTCLNVIIITVLPTFTRNVKPVLHTQTDDVELNKTVEKLAEEDKYTMGQVVFRCFITFIMALTLQFTGMSAVTNFAPKIMTSYGLDPLVGNVVLMGWNALVVFFVLPVSRVIPLRTLFITGSMANAFCCVFLCGVPVLPGIAREKVKNGVALAGIFIYIGLYQIFTGPGQFVIAIDMFPRPVKPYGMSAMNFFLSVFNLLTTLLYPIATENLSGGPSGNQDKGQAIAFMFFGVIGFITVIIEYFFMKPWIKPTTKVRHML